MVAEQTPLLGDDAAAHPEASAVGLHRRALTATAAGAVVFAATALIASTRTASDVTALRDAVTHLPVPLAAADIKDPSQALLSEIVANSLENEWSNLHEAAASYSYDYLPSAKPTNAPSSVPTSVPTALPTGGSWAPTRVGPHPGQAPVPTRPTAATANDPNSLENEWSNLQQGASSYSYDYVPSAKPTISPSSSV